MGARVEQLVKKFDESCAEFNKVVESLSDAEWKKVTSAEKWSVGVVAHHVPRDTRTSAGSSTSWPRRCPCPA
jgi:hypothetical protein